MLKNGEMDWITHESDWFKHPLVSLHADADSRCLLSCPVYLETSCFSENLCVLLLTFTTPLFTETAGDI